MAIVNTNENYTDPNSAIFDLAPFPMWIYDLETYKFMAVNREVVRQYGYSKEELLNMTIKDIRPDEDIPKLLRAVEHVRTRTELYKQSLFRHQRKDGSILHVQLKSNLITFNNRPAEIVTAIDLTERYKQQKFIEEQKKYLTIIGEINQILLKSNNWSNVLNQCFKIVGNALEVERIYFFKNNNLNKTTSQRLEWVKDKVEPYIKNPDLQDIPFNLFKEFIQPLKEGQSVETTISKLPFSSVKTLLEEHGLKSTLLLPVMVNEEFSGLIGLEDYKEERQWSENEFELLKNLTSNLGHVIKEEQIQQALKDSETRFKSLLLNNTDMITIMDAEANYTYAAPNIKTVLGIEPKDVIGKNAFQLIHKNDLAYIKKYHDITLKSQRISLEPYRVADSKGNWHWLQTELTNHLDNPAIKGVIANSRDVTAQVEKRLGDKLVANMTKAIGQPGELSSCLSKAIKYLVNDSGANACEIWLISVDKENLNRIATSFSKKKTEALYSTLNGFNIKSFKKGEGLPGFIWDTKESQFWATLSNNSQFGHTKTTKHIIQNLSAFGIPIFYNKEVLGCFICYYPINEFKPFHRRLLKKISEQLGPVIKQKITEIEYRNFFNLSLAPHCVVGFDGIIKRKNRALSKLLGYGEGELLNKSIFDYIYWKDVEQSKKQLQSAITDKKSSTFEMRFVTKTNEIRWLIWSVTVVLESKIFIAVGKDITEQKLAEKKFNKAFKQLKNAQKIAKLGYWTKYLKNDVNDWSEETYKLFGYTPDNFIPTTENIQKLFHPDDRHLYIKDLASILTPGEIKSFEHRIITADNKIKWVHEEMLLITNKQGEPVKVEGTIQDITETKAFEEKILISNERFRLAMQASNEMIWEMDHLKNKIYRSDVYKELFDYKLEESFDKESPWKKIIHPEDFERVNQSFYNSLKNPETSVWTEEYRLYTKDKNIAYVIDRSFIIRNEDGQAVRSVGSILDVTTSRKQLALIKKQNESLREIAWIQSHVLRAPLTRIMGLIYLHKEFGSTEKSIDEIFEIITESSQELDKVIHEITEKTNAITEDETRDITNR